MTIPYLTFLAFLFVHFYYAAIQDHERISKGATIDHAGALKDRVAGCGIAWAIAALITWHPVAFLFLPAGWAWWTAGFRFTLNRMRGKHWRYVSPSNVYDGVFIAMSVLLGQLDIPKRDRFTVKEIRLIMKDHAALIHASNLHWIDRRDGPDINILPKWYVQQVHRAGILAYTFEAVVFIVANLCIYLATK